MESQPGKIFVAHLKMEVTAIHLINYFSRYGKITDALIVTHRKSTNSRGFGFVTFDDPAVVPTVLDNSNHMILGQKVDVKQAKPKNQNVNYGDDDKINDDENNDTFKNSDDDQETLGCKKIFVGGLPPAITEPEMRVFFETFGAVTDAVVILNNETRRSRGFGFITFESAETAAAVLRRRFYNLNNSYVEVKRAIPRNSFVATPAYSSYNSFEPSYWSGQQWCSTPVLEQVLCPNGPCPFCASFGFIYRMRYCYPSQYSVDYSQYRQDDGEERINGKVGRESCEIGNSVCSSYSDSVEAEGAEHREGQMNDKGNKVASTDA